MRQKGFTLVELLAVIIILGVISLIVIPTVNGVLKKQKNKLYEKQVNTIENATIGWGAENTSSLPNLDESIYVSLDDLVKGGYLKKTDIKDPRNGDTLTGCVRIFYDSSYNQYNYKYINANDKEYNNECETKTSNPSL